MQRSRRPPRSTKLTRASSPTATSDQSTAGHGNVNRAPAVCRSADSLNAVTTDANGEPTITAEGAQTAPPTTATRAKHGAAKPTKGSHGSFFRELPFLILVAFVLALVIKAFLIQAFFIPSGSMERTLLIKDRVLVNKLIYDFRDVHRGEIVVFNGKHTSFQQESVIAPPSNVVASWLRTLQRALGLGAPGEKDFIKRVIGVAGDQVSCCAQGHVVVNGQPLDEPYLFEDSKLTFCSAGPGNLAPAQGEGACRAGSAPYTVPPHMLFVMGDHRSQSSDSRFNGPIATSTVIGRAFVRVWPLNRFGTLPVPKTFHSVKLTNALPPIEPSMVLGLAGAMPITALRWRLRARRRLRRGGFAG